MSADYESIARFVRKYMLEVQLPVTPLTGTKSAIKGLARGFAEHGWDVKDVAKPESKFVRNVITSPDGQVCLNMSGGKVFRHPPYTETICRRKHLTKKMLELAGLPLPIGSEFSPDESQIAAAYFEKMPKPIVIKPTDARSSQGVTVGISTLDEFEDAWQHAIAEGRAESGILIEQFVPGVELRAFVVGNEVAGVVARVQPFVVGDGNSNIDTLVSNLESERRVNVRAKMFSVDVAWDFVNRQGIFRDTVPESGAIVFLSPFNFPTMGSSVVDVSDIVSKGIIDLARRAGNAIPHLEVSGVDLLVGDLTDEKTAYVIEVNTAAALDMHRYPTHGSSRMVDEDIVAYFHGVYQQGGA